mmetsp:Transcript_18369/g.45996  ORF Transcript_18369/g.45996 Transcript_18369/m.45996 type:complete len:253 (+) Transcript_18369:144-902(+)
MHCEMAASYFNQTSRDPLWHAERIGFGMQGPDHARGNGPGKLARRVGREQHSATRRRRRLRGFYSHTSLPRLAVRTPRFGGDEARERRLLCPRAGMRHARDARRRAGRPSSSTHTAGGAHLEPRAVHQRGKLVGRRRLPHQNGGAAGARAEEAAVEHVGVLDPLLDEGVAHRRRRLAVLVVDHDHLVAVDRPLVEVHVPREVVGGLAQLSRVVVLRAVDVALVKPLEAPQVEDEEVAARAVVGGGGVDHRDD